ncbi:MAG: GNAT family N-acetyltransferase [Flavobacteriales bacterium]|nr:GNAT family N-acetyltransferase [Flavobacteriales bacterium]
MADYEIVQYDYRDISELREIYARSFGRDVGEDYFRWKYLEGPAGPVISFVARKEGRIAAFYGVLPERYTVDGEPAFIHQSMDTMTHPEHRGKGLFPRLARATCAHIQETTGKLHLIGYPGPTSINGFTQKLGWQCLVEMSYIFIYPWAFRVSNTLREKVDVEVCSVDAADPLLDAYFMIHRAQVRPIAKVVDKEVLLWRTFGHPMIAYKHLLVVVNGAGIGMCVYRIEADGRAFILWLDSLDDANIDICVHAVVGYLFRQRSTRSVHTFLSGDPKVRLALKRCGSMVNPFTRGPFSYRTPFIVLADPESIASGAYDAGRYWLQPITRDY